MYSIFHNCERLFPHCVTFERRIALAMAGSRRAARIPIMTITTSSSTRVKPFRLLDIELPPKVLVSASGDHRRTERHDPAPSSRCLLNRTLRAPGTPPDRPPRTIKVSMMNGLVSRQMRETKMTGRFVSVRYNPSAVRIFSVALLLALGACAGSEERPHSAVPPASEGGMSYLSAPPHDEASPNAKLAPAAALTLAAGDLLHITVFRQKDLELEVRVPQGGSISEPLTGDVQAAGKTVKAIEADIRQRLEATYLNRAGVTVTVREYTPRKVYVLGGVHKPGGYEIHPNRRLTLLQLVSTAGGYTDRAYKEYSQLIRH